MMNPSHILEVALLLLVAFLVGATVGSIARVLALRMRRAVPASVAAAVVPAAITPAEPALVLAPVIDPITKPVTPVAPESVPAPDFSEAIVAMSQKPDLGLMAQVRMPSIAPLPALEAKPLAAGMAPARQAGKTTSGIDVASPVVGDGPGLPAAMTTGAGAEVIPFPTDRAASNVDAMPALEAAVEALLEEAIASNVAVDIEAKLPEVEPLADVADEAKDADPEPDLPMIAADETAELPEPAPPEPVPDFPASELKVEPIPAEARILVEPDQPVATMMPPVAAIPEAVAPPVEPAEDDEAAAMRAIEGNWSPKRSAAKPADEPSPAIEVSADHAVAAAGAAVTSAVEAVMSAVAEQTAEPPGKPAGIDGPRHGVKDNLTNIIGIVPIIETALNTTGIYHFDQIAHFTDENVAWLEGHLGIAGRIGREHWREQARDLAVISARARKVAGKL